MATPEQSTHPEKKKETVKGCFVLIIAFVIIIFWVKSCISDNSETEKANAEIAVQEAKLQAAKKKIEAEKLEQEAARLEEERRRALTPEQRLLEDFKKQIEAITSIDDLKAKRKEYAEDPNGMEKYSIVSNRIDKLKEQQEKDIKDALKYHFSKWDGSLSPLEKQIKTNLNDPGSYDHDRTHFKFITSLNKMYVECRFRANNQFGAKVISYAACHLNPDGTIEGFKFRETPILNFKTK